MNDRAYSPLDQLLIQFDQALRTVGGRPAVTGRAHPAAAIPESTLSDSEKRHVAGLMRINHSGEVAAQALYQGQALTARLPEVREAMEHAAAEENDHLEWCESRLHELGDRTSLLKPFWYAGSFVIGAVAGAIGDKWSLGFVAETERQVVRHLDDHLEKLPPQDQRSRRILEQMRTDEGHHATTAVEAGGAELPTAIKSLMGLTSKIMTRTAYKI
ncbi:MAG: 2-polyprenyl-3-methyl-6-methoxy-1,4-benzoquinone monooxygenase [Gammaproteobacteria bacterium]|nr:2-polyprenyl-3-methyl-6-methoxy-1,4-benzoquinone monooxygenase [Gammaproteobacteria bacterium]MCP5137105.1 2-polyprenyl-3-methyl-6-methoxy-1,4-benzoquinone monooxygenase [Gammaproteobacteria bacterium]